MRLEIRSSRRLPVIPSVACGRKPMALSAVMYARYSRLNCGSYGMLRKTASLVFGMATEMVTRALNRENLLACGCLRPAGGCLPRPGLTLGANRANNPSVKINANQRKNLPRSGWRNSEALGGFWQRERLEIEFYGASHRTSSQLFFILSRSLSSIGAFISPVRRLSHWE